MNIFKNIFNHVLYKYLVSIAILLLVLFSGLLSYNFISGISYFTHLLILFIIGQIFSIQIMIYFLHFTNVLTKNKQEVSYKNINISQVIFLYLFGLYLSIWLLTFSVFNPV